MNTSKQQIVKDPRFAAARPWDWQVCTKCEDLVPVTQSKCPRCGDAQFDASPGAVIAVGLRKHGMPPSRFDALLKSEN